MYQNSIEHLYVQHVNNNIENIQNPVELLYTNWSWGSTDYGVTTLSLIRTIEILIIQIQNGRFINYSYNEYMKIAHYIINIVDDTDIHSRLYKLKQQLITTLETTINKETTILEDIEKKILDKIDSNRTMNMDGKKIFITSPQLERCGHWSNELHSHKITRLLGKCRRVMREKYNIVCCYIEELLFKKTLVQNETIKLELSLKNSNCFPLHLCINENILSIIEFNKEINYMLSKLNLTLLYDKNRKFRISDEWWIREELVLSTCWRNQNMICSNK